VKKSGFDHAKYGMRFKQWLQSVDEGLTIGTATKPVVNTNPTATIQATDRAVDKFSSNPKFNAEIGKIGTMPRSRAEMTAKKLGAQAFKTAKKPDQAMSSPDEMSDRIFSQGTNGGQMKVNAALKPATNAPRPAV
jgi:hypothetical protein